MSILSTSLCSGKYLDEIVEEEEERSEASSSEEERPKQNESSSSSPLSSAENNNYEEFIISSIDTGKSRSGTQSTYKDFIISSIDTKFSSDNSDNVEMDDAGYDSTGVVTTPDLMEKLDSLIEASDLEMNFLNKSSSSFLEAIETLSSSLQYSPDFFNESSGLLGKEKANHSPSFHISSSNKQSLSPPNSEESMGVEQQARELDTLVTEWTKATRTTTTPETIARHQHSQTKPRKLVFPDHPNSPLCRMAGTRFDDDNDDEDDESSVTDNDGHVIAQSPLATDTSLVVQKEMDSQTQPFHDEDSKTSRHQQQQQPPTDNKKKASSTREVLRPRQQHHRTPSPLSNQQDSILDPCSDHPESFKGPLVCSCSSSSNNNDNDNNRSMTPTAALVDQEHPTSNFVRNSDIIDTKFSRQQQKRETRRLLPPTYREHASPPASRSSSNRSSGCEHCHDNSSPDERQKRTPPFCDGEMETEVVMTSSTSTEDASLEEGQSPITMKQGTCSDRISPLQTTFYSENNDRNNEISRRQEQILEIRQAKLNRLDATLFYLIQAQLLLAQVFGALLSYFLYVTAPSTTTTTTTPQPHHWHLDFVGIGLAFGGAVFPSLVTPGVLFRTRLSAAMICLWMLRLTSFSILRIHDLGGVDARLTEQLATTRGIAEYWSLVAAWSIVTLLPHSLGTMSRHPGRVWSTVGGVLIFLVGLTIESAADWQKWEFYHSADGFSTRSFCSAGLWSVVQHPDYVGEILVWFGIAVLHAPALVDPPTTQNTGFVRRVWNIRRVFLAFSSPLAVAAFLAAQASGSLGNARDLAYSKHGYLLNPDYTNYIDRTPLFVPWSYDEESSRFWSKFLTGIQRAFDGGTDSVEPKKSYVAHEELSGREIAAKGAQSSGEDGVVQPDVEASPATPSTLTIDADLKGSSVQPFEAYDQGNIAGDVVPFNSLKGTNSGRPDGSAKLSVAQVRREQEALFLSQTIVKEQNGEKPQSSPKLLTNTQHTIEDKTGRISLIEIVASEDALSSSEVADLQAEALTEELASTVQAETELSSEEFTDASAQAQVAMKGVVEGTNTIDGSCIQRYLLEQSAPHYSPEAKTTETIRDDTCMPETAALEPIAGKPPEIAMLMDIYKSPSAELKGAISQVQSAMKMDVEDNTIADGNVVANAWSDRNDVRHSLEAETDHSQAVSDRAHMTETSASESDVAGPPETVEEFEDEDPSTDSIYESPSEEIVRIEKLVTQKESNENDKVNVDQPEIDEPMLVLTSHTAREAQAAKGTCSEDVQPLSTDSGNISQDTAENVPDDPSFEASVHDYVVPKTTLDLFLQKDEPRLESTQSKHFLKASEPVTPKIAPQISRIQPFRDIHQRWKDSARLAKEKVTTRSDELPHVDDEPIRKTAVSHSFECEKGSTQGAERLKHEISSLSDGPAIGTARFQFENKLLQGKDSALWKPKPPPLDHEVNVTNILSMLQQMSVGTEEFYMARLDNMKHAARAPPTDHIVNMTRITTILRQLTVVSEDPLVKIESRGNPGPARPGPLSGEDKVNIPITKSIPPVQKTECCIGPLDKIKRAFYNHLKKLLHNSNKTFPLNELWQVDDDKLAEG